MKLILNCVSWNKYLPEQYVWETNCGYHAFRNGRIMYNILKNLDKFNNYEEYIKKNS